jgi:hypothetical protein
MSFSPDKTEIMLFKNVENSTNFYFYFDGTKKLGCMTYPVIVSGIDAFSPVIGIFCIVPCNWYFCIVPCNLYFALFPVTDILYSL